MIRVDELIKKLCPNGVESKRIGDLAVVGTGSSDRKDASLDGPYPFYVRSKQLMKHDNFEFDETAIIIPGEGNIGEVFHYQTGKYALHQRAYRIAFTTDSVLTKFAFYYFAANFKNFILKKAVSATVTSIRKPMVTDFEIPVPPLEIQQEIAGILDKFTQLEAELEAELEARRKQYAYYREQLLTFPETGGQPLKLADVCRRISTGSTPKAGSRKYYENGTIPWLRTAEVSFNTIYSTETAITEAALAETGVSWVEAQSIVVAISGATAGRSAVTAIPLTTNQHCCNMAIDSEKADFRYVFHWLGAHYEDLKQRGRGARADLNLSIIKNFPIVLPPLEEQRRIVAILDKFDALVNDISTGLPAEIAARRKQYEYYRDKLLSFEPV